MRDSTGTETNLAATGTLYNFLTNPGFEIWQRGAGPFTAEVYAADRWQFGAGGTPTISMTDETTVVDSQSAHSLKAVFTASTPASAISQYLKTSDTLYLRGLTLTFRLRAQTATASAVRAFILTDGTGGTQTFSGYHSGGSTFESLDVTVAVPSDATYVRIGLSLSASCTAYLDNATLVIGSTAQTYYPLHPAEEWERCQRYYEALDPNGPSNVPSHAHYMASGAVETWSIPLPFATRKAVAPTTTKVGTWAVTNANQPGADVSTLTHWSMTISGTGVDGSRVVVAPNSADDTFSFEANP